MADDKLKIYVWPDGSWESEEEIDDMDWYLTSSGKSDDYAEYKVPLELEAEDIDELIELNALPGMLPDTVQNKIEDQGVIPLPHDSILILTFTSEEDPYLTHLEGKIIINCTNMSIEVLKGGK